MAFDPDSLDLLGARTTAAQVMSSPPFAVSPDLPLSDAWWQTRPETQDYDVVLVGGTEGRAMARPDPSWAGAAGRIMDVASPVPEGALVNVTAPLGTVLEALNAHGFCLCADDGDEVSGIVTTSDLNRPEASLFVFGLVLSFEQALARLVPSLSSGSWAASASRRKPRPGMSLWDSLMFGEKVDIAGAVLPEALSMTTPEWNAATAGFNTMRKNLAHARGISFDLDPDGLVPLLFRVRALNEDLWTLVADRDAVWEAYAKTQCFVEFEGELLPLAGVLGALPECFWMVSAQNPGDTPYGHDENQRRHEALVGELERRGVLLAEGVGKAPSDEHAWSERMAVAAFSERAEAVEVSRLLGQRSAFEIDGTEQIILDVATGVERLRVKIAR